ncbi:hypothetical protein ZWY2020_044557 [Hordeum vulgare]|nr:hypothetical protein ZWY2020_044557 [Hordeum vulgare]
MATLSSPRIVSCIGGRGAGDGSYQLFLEFAPGGSLAEQVASNGGLDERSVRGSGASAWRLGSPTCTQLGWSTGRQVKERRHRRADGAPSSRISVLEEGGVPIIGGTPAFMAPEVARGEEQGPAADVWALGCMVVEMATGRAPWSGIDGNALAALHRIGYTEAVPEVPEWLSADGKDFLASCLVRQASGRCTAAQLLEHPFLASAVVEVKPQAVASKWVSPKSTLDAAFWESESESDTEEAQHDSTAEMRIKAFACPASALPDWDSKEGWIVVLSAPTVAPEAASEETTDMDDDAITNEEPSGAEPAVLGMIVYQECSSVVGAGDAYDDSLFLEFAPGGSLAEQVASNGGLDERSVRGYALDVASGLTYLHAAGMVHGDVKSRNVVIGADGRAKLADFGCSRKAAADVPIIGGTPAFMAPEVARGEEQGPAADVWALGCMVVEMATGRAPWSGIDGNALAALHRIGYTEAVPEVPEWLSADGKDFLASCLVAGQRRCTAAQLLEHPFLASAVVEVKPQAVASKWVSPKSTLDAAFWESESESDTEEAQHDSTAEMRIKAFACPASALPDWDSKEGWIVVLSAPTVAPEAASEETTDMDDDAITNEEPSGAEPAVLGMIVYQECSSVVGAGDAYDDSVGHSIVSCGGAPLTLLPALPRVSPGGWRTVATNGARSAVCGYATDVATGLAYLHGAGIVHGDVKSRNIVIGADGRAKLMDFGCSRKAGAAADVPIIGGTPAFMAPEVARGEDQGPAADVWRLAARSPRLRRRGAAWTATHSRCTGSVHAGRAEVPESLSADEGLLGQVPSQQASDRCRAAQLLEHRFLASAAASRWPQAAESKWVSPKSTLDAAFWETESDTEEAEHEHSRHSV